VKKKKSKTIDAEIVRVTDSAPRFDIEEMSTDQLRRHVHTLTAQLHARQLELANLQVDETKLHLLSQHRALLVQRYVQEIAALDRVTPGGLKSVQPSEDDDPELVDEAWRIYVQMQRGGGSRFG
jgi:hypothetical protein